MKRSVQRARDIRNAAAVLLPAVVMTVVIGGYRFLFGAPVSGNESLREEKDAAAVFQPLYGTVGTESRDTEQGELRLQLLARALSAFSAREGDGAELAILTGCGQALCSRVSDPRFPDELTAVCLEAFPELYREDFFPSALCLSAAEDALCSPPLVGGAVFLSHAGEQIPGEVCAVIGEYVFSK